MPKETGSREAVRFTVAQFLSRPGALSPCPLLIEATGGAHAARLASPCHGVLHRQSGKRWASVLLGKEGRRSRRGLSVRAKYWWTRSPDSPVPGPASATIPKSPSGPAFSSAPTSFQLGALVAKRADANVPPDPFPCPGFGPGVSKSGSFMLRRTHCFWLSIICFSSPASIACGPITSRPHCLQRL